MLVKSNCCTVWFRILASAIFATAYVHAQVNVLTSNYDNQRTNSNVHESILSPESVNPVSFGRVGAFPVDGNIYAQPLYVSGVKIGRKGPHNVVYVATMHNSVYAIDADAPQSTTPLWMVNLGQSIPSTVFSFSDILPEVGILSTPVIDPVRGVIYVVSNTLEQGVTNFRLHALSLSDGSEKMNGPVKISAAVPGTGPESHDGVLNFEPSLHLQRPGLALANGAVYLAFGSHADLGIWHGWLMSYDASNLQHQLGIVNTSPDNEGGSIWQSGRAPAIDDHGDLYVVTGNGNFDGSSAFGESVLHVAGSPGTAQTDKGKLKVVDWFTPADWSTLNDNDDDFGSTGAMLVPQTNLLLAGSKAGTLYVVPRDSMGHVQPSNSTKVQAAHVNDWGMFDMALWNAQSGPIVYLVQPHYFLKAFQIVNGRLNPTELSQTDVSSFFTGIAVSANGGAQGTGIVWLTTGDYAVSGIPGALHALDASDVSKELWSSNTNDARDGLGRFAKFVAPTVANGRVYVPTFSNALVVYGLFNGSQDDTAPPQVSSVVNGASFLGEEVSAGEVVAVFGVNLGTSELTQMQLDSNGKVSTSLAGTQVLFDGVPAPLLYTSSTQVGAIVPFGIAGPTTQVQVVYGGQTSAAITRPVAPSAPSLFSVDGNGGGYGVINPDGQTNSSATTTPAGSIVTFYATGGGRTIPASVDGEMTASATSYPVPLLPVRVLIGGQDAEVVYAGAAPGMPAGILQVNARVPDTMWGYNFLVELQVGKAVSPNSLQINVQ